MVRDTEQTKYRIREAAISEFAKYGQHGTTMERIAARGGGQQGADLPLLRRQGGAFWRGGARGGREGRSGGAAGERKQVEDFGEIAGRTFDYQRAHPDLARLVLWEGLADTEAWPKTSRVAVLTTRSKVEEA